jgi:hypothetical protein
MSSVFDLFKKADPAPSSVTPAAQSSAAQNPTVPGPTNMPAASGDTSTVAGAGGGATSPLDAYKDLWKNDPNAKPDAPFTFNSDPTKLLDTAKTVDFTKVVTAETMAKITAGGTGAQQAMMEAMNNMSQMAFAQSAHASAKITESALQAQEQRFKDMLPNLIKQHSVADNLRTSNPLMTDPALAPMVGALQQQFTKQYPQATAREIQNHVSDFLDGAADRITGMRPQPKDTSNKRAEEDWGKFFSS